MKKDKRLLHRALDGEVTQSETKILKRQLQENGKMRAEYEQLKKVVKDTEKIKIDVPENFTQKVLSETTRLRKPKP